MKMTETEQFDTTQATTDQELIKEAKQEIVNLDVFVCGSCHDVFHYIEHFQEHKQDGACIGVSTLRDETNTDQKTQVWGFLLWKNAKFKNDADNANDSSSWSIYQQWCNLEIPQKDAWIAAGQSILLSYKIGTAKAPETTSTSCQTTSIKIVDDDGDGDMHKFDSSADAMESESETDSEEDIEKELAEMEGLPRPRKKKKLKSNDVKNILKPVQINRDTNKDPACKKAYRTFNDKKEECTIEKIIFRRYNRGKKMFEYYIKWENLDHEQNTWEPASHIEGCKLLLDEFEKNLQKQKAQKLQQKQIISKKLAKTKLLEENAQLTQEGRPQRTSKQKALNQVKVWCGNISDADDTASKRAFSDSDSSDSLEKKIKMEADSSDSDYDRPPVTIKKVKQNILNGTGKKPLPDNVLIPDAQGVIRINQKQLPALSSGVYVMSKTAGIIKLDSNTSKIAASGGHAVIKVAPKMGQASIKVIKKEPGATNGSKLPLITSKVKPPTRVYASKAIKRNFPLKKPENVVMPGKIFEDEEDESDGLEELEFPTDLPLPPPDSPPGEFSLDPETGKLAGHEYPTEEIKLEEQNDGTATLENLVEMTAAQMLDSDNKEKESQEKMEVESQNENTTDILENKKENRLAEVQQIQEPEVEIKKEIINENSTLNTSSILSKALSSANIESNETIVQKKQINAPSLVKQKSLVNKNVLNRTVSSQSQPQAIITRITPGTSRNRPPIQKPVTSPTVNRKVIRQTYVNKNSAARKLPTSTPTTTTTYFVQTQTPEVVRNPQPTILNTKQNLPATTAVINMPLLTETEQENTAVAVQIQDTEPNQVIQQIENTDLNTFSLADSESPLLITGEDGTIYQVAGQNEEGQTILITQGADGQQQCLLVASENTSELNQAISASVVNAEPEEPVVIKEETENAEDSQVVAQIVDAQPPSPGGTRKVVLMLPDGNLMMTEVTAEQYAALELDK